MEIKSNVKLIVSGNVPTTSDLAVGELAFGIINSDGKVHLYCNPGDSINSVGKVVELSVEISD